MWYNDYSHILLLWTVRLEEIKQKMESKAILSEGLICSCKSNLSNKIIITIQNLMIYVVSCHLQKIPLQKTEFKKIKNEFVDYIFTSTFVHQKFFLVFDILATKLFQYFFNKVKQTDDLEEILKLIHRYTEILLLLITGFKLNDFNFSYDIFKDFDKLDYIDNEKDFENNVSSIPFCPFKCENCKTPSQELLHLFFVKEFLEIEEFIPTLINILKKYHCHIKNITIIFDFSLINEIDLNKYEYLNELVVLFKFKIVNYEHLSIPDKFTKYLSNIKDVPVFLDKTLLKEKQNVKSI